MKYIITESKLDKMVIKFLEEKDSVTFVRISDGMVYVFLEPNVHVNEMKTLVDQITRMFGYHGQILKKSITPGQYIMTYQF